MIHNRITLTLVYKTKEYLSKDNTVIIHYTLFFQIFQSKSWRCMRKEFFSGHIQDRIVENKLYL